PRPTILNSPTLVLNLKASSNSSASRCRTWSDRAMANREKEDRVARRGLMLVLSSPSGAGKTTLSRKLLDIDKNVMLSVSVTTRKMRPGEKDGWDYHYIDWQGTQQLREKARTDLASVFVLPPSIPELERRLHERAQDDYETIHRRMAKAADEMSHWAEYDYVVINRDLTQAFADVSAILAAERLKRERQPGLSDFVRSLQAKI